ncbi:hypothetical protein BZA05DRAFT_449500 [Tricharina praecox]|uniref:uncharacterized protein n=1 Tax=Tricharina praecox TaxID=43433 RepID=UPI00221E80A9|nr:uncharacterized protein BZA05DRAFT_449500 [Tricharina praecox]KAI5841620.1 hypothetical protein BZA05DRAFT_449500 [Tricharina praecox]
MWNIHMYVLIYMFLFLPTLPEAICYVQENPGTALQVAIMLLSALYFIWSLYWHYARFFPLCE